MAVDVKAEGSAWSIDELAASVDSYNLLLRSELAGTRLSKAGVYRQLAARFGRKEGAYERRLQNVSYVRSQLGLQLVSGIPRATNVGTRVAARIRILVEERERDISVSSSEVAIEKDAAADGDLGERARLFSLVEQRPAQAAFRRAVFLAWSGRCVITGCEVKEALDAAHLKGRNWRLGDNGAVDGILLRKDLHALYDCGLLSISEPGDVRLHALALDHYAHLDGVRIAGPKTLKTTG